MLQEDVQIEHYRKAYRQTGDGRAYHYVDRARYGVKEAAVATNEKALSVGDKGKTITRLAPMGTVRFEKLSCEAKSEDNTMLDPGTRVVISAIEDNRVIVKPIKD